MWNCILLVMFFPFSLFLYLARIFFKKNNRGQGEGEVLEVSVICLIKIFIFVYSISLQREKRRRDKKIVAHTIFKKTFPPAFACLSAWLVECWLRGRLNCWKEHGTLKFHGMEGNSHCNWINSPLQLYETCHREKEKLAWKSRMGHR